MTVDEADGLLFIGNVVALKNLVEPPSPFVKEALV